MKHLTKPTFISLLLILALFLTTSMTQARSGGAGYDLSWWTVDGGGRTGGSQTHPYALGSTIGQHDATVWQGDGYTLAGGFWGGALAL